MDDARHRLDRACQLACAGLQEHRILFDLGRKQVGAPQKLRESPRLVSWPIILGQDQECLARIGGTDSERPAAILGGGDALLFGFDPVLAKEHDQLDCIPFAQIAHHVDPLAPRREQLQRENQRELETDLHLGRPPDSSARRKGRIGWKPRNHRSDSMRAQRNAATLPRQRWGGIREAVRDPVARRERPGS